MTLPARPKTKADPGEAPNLFEYRIARHVVRVAAGSLVRVVSEIAFRLAIQTIVDHLREKLRARRLLLHDVACNTENQD